MASGIQISPCKYEAKSNYFYSKYSLSNHLGVPAFLIENNRLQIEPQRTNINELVIPKLAISFSYFCNIIDEQHICNSFHMWKAHLRKTLCVLSILHLFCKYFEKKLKYTLIQNLRLSSAVLNAMRRQSAAHTAISSRSICAIGLAPGFNSLMKNSLKVCIQNILNYK